MKQMIKKSLAILLAVLLMVPSVTGLSALADDTRYDLTYTYTDADGKPQPAGTIKLKAGDPVDVGLQIPTGQKFSGWFTDAGLEQPAPEVMPAENLTIYASFSWIDYTVTYTLDNVVIKTQIQHYGDALELPEVTVETGYTFSGWSDSEGTEYDATKPVLGDLNLFGTLNMNDYTLTYIVNGKICKTEVANYGDVLSYYDYPTETGYTFSGWFSDADCTKTVPVTMPDGDLTVYGKYTQNHYTISYFVDGVDTNIKQENYVYGDTIEPITNYDETEGRTFSGWFADAAMTKAIPTTMPDHDLTFYGKLTPNKYNLTYILNGSYHTMQTYEYDQVIDYLTFIPQEGVTFSDWRLENGDVKPLRMPAYNVTVYGSRTQLPAANINGGTYENITVGDSVEVTISMDAPYLTGMTVSDIVFDEDIFMLDKMEWLCGGTQKIELGNRKASVSFEENTNLDGDVLTLTFVVLNTDAVGMHEISFSASATTDMGIGLVDVKTVITPAKVQVICATHRFAGGEVVANKNNTHSVTCANGCGVSIQQACSGGTATCLQKAVCSVCEATYGQKLAHDYSGASRGNGDGTHSYRCVSGCGEFGTEKISCTYGVAMSNKDNTSHTLTCTVCGESKTENCYGGTVTCLQVATCDRCNTAYGDVLPHAYTGAVKNNYDGTHERLCVNGCNTYGGRTDCEYAYENKTPGVHTNTCTACGYTIDEYCSGGKASCIAPANCAYCLAAYGSACGHLYAGEARDNHDGTHSLLCLNGCNEYGVSIRCDPDEYVSNGNGTHTAVCPVCDAVLQGNCTGGTATCIAAAQCEVCNSAYGSLLPHDFSGALTPNGDGTHSKLCVNGCELTSEDVQPCTFGEWVSDGNGTHSKVCTECNDKITEACTGGTASCTEKAVCEVCLSAYGELLAHTFPQGEQGQATGNNDGTHTRFCSSCEQDVILPCDYYSFIPNANGMHIAICKVCNYTDTQHPCFGGAATCQAPAVCDGCHEPYGDALGHDFSGAAKDNKNGTHTLQCVNGCEEFGGEAIVCTPGDFVSNGNDTHSAHCTACDAVITEACSGGIASCEQQAVCDKCNSGYGLGGDHHYETTHNDKRHWGECTGCGKTTPADDHVFTEWVVETPATQQSTGLRRHHCMVCGAVFTEVMPRPFARGDVDFDNRVTASDARSVLRYSVGLENLDPIALLCADADLDGLVSSSDARLLLRASVNLEDASLWEMIGLDNDGNVIT